MADELEPPTLPTPQTLPEEESSPPPDAEALAALELRIEALEREVLEREMEVRRQRAALFADELITRLRDLHPGGCSDKVVISSRGATGRRFWKADGRFLILLYGCWRNLINFLSAGRSLYLLAGLCSDVAVGGSPCQWEILFPC